MSSDRIREGDLVEPVLQLIAEHGDDEGGLDISRIDRLLRTQLVLSDQDQKRLNGRKDDRFSQVVRNLVSHRTLEKKGLAIYRNTGVYRRGAYYLTQEGAAAVGAAFKPQQGNLFE